MTSDLIAKTEARRRLLRLSQQELAHQLGMTQGHYSKVMRLQVPLAPASEAKLKGWLEQSHKGSHRKGEETERLAGLIALHANGLSDAVNAFLKEVGSKSPVAGGR
jgi:transcriptional regulator with XRE-family HTH domain